MGRKNKAHGTVCKRNEGGDEEMIDLYELGLLERRRDKLAQPPSRANLPGYEMVDHNNWCIKSLNKKEFLEILEKIQKIKEMS